MFIESISAHANHNYILFLFKTVLTVTVEFSCSQSFVLELTSHSYRDVFTNKRLFACCDPWFYVPTFFFCLDFM